MIPLQPMVQSAQSGHQHGGQSNSYASLRLESGDFSRSTNPEHAVTGTIQSMTDKRSNGILRKANTAGRSMVGKLIMPRI